MESSLSQYIETITPPRPNYVWELTLRSPGGGECMLEIVSQSLTNAIARCSGIQQNNPHIREAAIVKAIRRKPAELPPSVIGE